MAGTDKIDPESQKPMQRWLLLLLAAAALPLPATTCAVVAPCAAIGPNSVIFIGEVDRPPIDSKTNSLLRGKTVKLHMTVREVFAGLPTATKELEVETEDWMLPGLEYLVDARRNPDGTYATAICGRSQAVNEANEFLRYLRARKRGQAKTSLKVSVVTMAGITMIPVPEAEVLVIGPKEEKRARTDADGIADFADVDAGLYSVTASKPHYHPDSRIPATPQIEVLTQTCPSTSVHVAPESTLSGMLRSSDGKGIASVDLELVGVDPERVRRGFATASYYIKSDDRGAFRFDQVNPGTYVLGTNIRYEDIPTSPVPRSYYPGRPTRAEAVEILVGEGSQIEGLQFTLSNAGSHRRIRVRVVDEHGVPVAGARVGDVVFGNPDKYALFGREWKTDGKGCLDVVLFEGARYRIQASHGELRSDLRASEAAEIAPGKDELTVVLVLRPQK